MWSIFVARMIGTAIDRFTNDPKFFGHQSD